MVIGFDEMLIMFYDKCVMPWSVLLHIKFMQWIYNIKIRGEYPHTNWKKNSLTSAKTLPRVQLVHVCLLRQCTTYNVCNKWTQAQYINSMACSNQKIFVLLIYGAVEVVFFSHAGVLGSIPVRDRPISFKKKQVVTAPLPNARQQVWVPRVLGEVGPCHSIGVARLRNLWACS